MGRMEDIQDILDGNDRVLQDATDAYSNKGGIAQVGRFAVGIFDRVKKPRANEKEAWASNYDPVRSATEVP